MTEAQFNIIVDQYGRGLLHFVHGSLRDLDESKSVVQDTFEILWLKRDAVNIDSVKSFLFTVAHRKTIDYLRRMKFTDYTDTLPERKVQAQDNSAGELVFKALKQLPEIQRKLVELRDLHGYDYKEIETMMDLTASQVKVYLFRARKNMKNIITQLEAVRL